MRTATIIIGHLLALSAIGAIGLFLAWKLRKSLRRATLIPLLMAFILPACVFVTYGAAVLSGGTWPTPMEFVGMTLGCSPLCILGYLQAHHFPIPWLHPRTPNGRGDHDLSDW